MKNNENRGQKGLRRSDRGVPDTKHSAAVTGKTTASRQRKMNRKTANPGMRILETFCASNPGGLQEVGTVAHELKIRASRFTNRTFSAASILNLLRHTVFGIPGADMNQAFFSHRAKKSDDA